MVGSQLVTLSTGCPSELLDIKTVNLMAACLMSISAVPWSLIRLRQKQIDVCINVLSQLDYV